MSAAKTTIETLLHSADIAINGQSPWDMQVHDERLYDRVLAQGSLGLGEAYMAGWWDCDQLDEFIAHIMRAKLNEQMHSWRLALFALKARLLNPQRKTKAFEIGQRHYDIGNDLYQLMLDKRMTYTCGYWTRSTSSGQGMTLDEAQEAKLDLVCHKLGLQPGMTVLDIGCGWGSFMKYAAERYGVKATGITVSKQQVALGEKLCAGLPIKFVLQDYRDVSGEYDRIVSLGMFEHVGYKNYRQFMEVTRRCLRPDGLFLLHTIASNVSNTSSDPWIDKYIFPNSLLPSIAQIGRAIEHVFVMEDWHNFSAYYEPTLLAWWHNFDSQWDKLKDHYDERFYRMWKFYLLSFAALFRTRHNQLWQIVLSPHGVPGGYRSIR